jgi:frataxin-like iron-binding protein CyaY
MDKLNLSNQISQDKNYFSNEKSARSKRLKIIIVGILSLLSFISLIFAGYTYLKSQKPISPPWEKLTPEAKQEIELFERFPNSSNKGNIAIDQNFIWVANGAGLIRYNKHTGEQKIFTESDGLLGNETRQVLKYKDELWIASQSRGISILDTKNNSWRYFTTANGLVNGGNLIMKLDDNILWLATFDGFGRYDFKTGTWTNWREGAGVRFAGVEDFVFNDDFVWIYVTPNAYTRGGVLRLDKRSLTWQDLQFNNQIFSERQLWHSPALYLDNNYLYALADKKIYRQNIISGQWEVFDKNEENLIKFHIGAKIWRSILVF